MVPKAEKGVSVWDQAEKWADLRRREFLGRPRTNDVLVITRKNYDLLQSTPPLVEGAQKEFTLLLTPFGMILVPIWGEAKVIKIEERLSLEVSQDHVQLRRRRQWAVDLDDLPSGRRVVRLNLDRHNTIEGAIRQQVHIRDAHSVGREVAQVDQVMAFVDDKLKTVLAGGLNRDSLSLLVLDTGVFLEGSGLTTARDSLKKRVTQTLAKVPNLDALARINPLAMAVRLRSAYLDAVKREIFSVLVLEKFGVFLGILLTEREITRRTIAHAIKDLDTVMGFTKRGAIVFVDLGRRAQAGEAEGINIVFKEIASSLLEVGVAPYLRPARQAALNLIGGRPEDFELNESLIGSGTLAFFSDTPVLKLITEERLPEARYRIEEFSYNPLKEILEANADMGIQIDQ